MRRGLLFGVLVGLGVNKEEEGCVSSQGYVCIGVGMHLELVLSKMINPLILGLYKSKILTSKVTC
jgi:hypothetical protein